MRLPTEQRNNNVVTYHFGDRDGLVGEIYAYRSEQLNNRRIELINDLDIQGKGEAGKGLPAGLGELQEPHCM
jgi:hypothetical protein